MLYAVCALVVMLLFGFIAKGFFDPEKAPEPAEPALSIAPAENKMPEPRDVSAAEMIAVYRELFRDGPVGSWSDPKYAFSRVVTYKDWEFHPDGSGNFIFFTAGTGVNTYPFKWEPVGERRIRIMGIPVPHQEIENDEDAGDDGFSPLPDSSELSYDFVARGALIYLVADDYNEMEIPAAYPEKIGRLSLNGGEVNDLIRKQYRW
jgi:hypothetical protein